MKIFRDINDLPEFKNAAITTGTFDGVHLGHRQILNTLIRRAEETEGESVLLTFWPHPRMVLQPDDHGLKLLNTIDEKISILEKTGLENLVIIPFTLEFSKMNYKDFISEILVKKLGVKSLIIGHDHHFGKDREGNFEQLVAGAPEFGFELIQVEPLTIDKHLVSSSLIRNALTGGETKKANILLGYSYEISGKVTEGKKRGKGLGYPTANIIPDEPYKLIPADGVYAVEAIYNHHIYKGMANIGYNPTFADTGKTLEVNIFNFDKDIYNKKIIIKFCHYLRKEIKFVTREELVQQLEADKRETNIFFNDLK